MPVHHDAPHHSWKGLLSTFHSLANFSVIFAGCHTTGPHYAFKSIIPYPFNEDPTLFLPYRYNNVAN